MATKTAPTKTTRIPRFDGDERTFLLIDSDGLVEWGPDNYACCHQRLRHVHNWKGAIVHKSNPERALPVPKNRHEWEALRDTWEWEVGNKPCDLNATGAAQTLGFRRLAEIKQWEAERKAERDRLASQASQKRFPKRQTTHEANGRRRFDFLPSPRKPIGIKQRPATGKTTTAKRAGEGVSN